ACWLRSAPSGCWLAEAVERCRVDAARCWQDRTGGVRVLRWRPGRRDRRWAGRGRAGRRGGWVAVDRAITESLNSWFSVGGVRVDLARVLAVAPLAVIAVLWLCGWLARRGRDPQRRALLVVGLLAAGLGLALN